MNRYKANLTARETVAALLSTFVISITLLLTAAGPVNAGDLLNAPVAVSQKA